MAVIRFWRNLTIRIAGLTCVLLEWLGLGAKPLIAGTPTLPGFLLPWQYLQHLPLLGGMVPDRLCILADAAAAVVLAFALDRARTAMPFAGWRDGAMVATGIAVLALLPLVPAPYVTAPVRPGAGRLVPDLRRAAPAVGRQGAARAVSVRGDLAADALGRRPRPGPRR